MTTIQLVNFRSASPSPSASPRDQNSNPNALQNRVACSAQSALSPKAQQPAAPDEKEIEASRQLKKAILNDDLDQTKQLLSLEREDGEPLISHESISRVAAEIKRTAPQKASEFYSLLTNACSPEEAGMELIEAVRHGSEQQISTLLAQRSDIPAQYLVTALLHAMELHDPYCLPLLLTEGKLNAMMPYIEYMDLQGHSDCLALVEKVETLLDMAPVQDLLRNRLLAFYSRLMITLSSDEAGAKLIKIRSADQLHILLTRRSDIPYTHIITALLQALDIRDPVRLSLLLEKRGDVLFTIKPTAMRASELFEQNLNETHKHCLLFLQKAEVLMDPKYVIASDLLVSNQIGGHLTRIETRNCQGDRELRCRELLQHQLLEQRLIQPLVIPSPQPALPPPAAPINIPLMKPFDGYEHLLEFQTRSDGSHRPINEVKIPSIHTIDTSSNEDIFKFDN